MVEKNKIKVSLENELEKDIELSEGDAKLMSWRNLEKYSLKFSNPSQYDDGTHDIVAVDQKDGLIAYIVEARMMSGSCPIQRFNAVGVYNTKTGEIAQSEYENVGRNFWSPEYVQFPENEYLDVKISGTNIYGNGTVWLHAKNKEGKYVEKFLKPTSVEE